MTLLHLALIALAVLPRVYLHWATLKQIPGILRTLTWQAKVTFFCYSERESWIPRVGRVYAQDANGWRRLPGAWFALGPALINVDWQGLEVAVPPRKIPNFRARAPRSTWLGQLSGRLLPAEILFLEVSWDPRPFMYTEGLQGRTKWRAPAWRRRYEMAGCNPSADWRYGPFCIHVIWRRVGVPEEPLTGYRLSAMKETRYSSNHLTSRSTHS